MGAKIAGVRDQFPKLKLIGSIHISDPEEEFASSFLARSAKVFLAAVNKVAPPWSTNFQDNGRFAAGMSRKEMMKRFREYMMARLRCLLHIVPKCRGAKEDPQQHPEVKDLSELDQPNGFLLTSKLPAMPRSASGRRIV
ncbi:hypothetical protein PSPO01_15357 [Paraphaeosphaeria sporulosa]